MAGLLGYRARWCEIKHSADSAAPGPIYTSADVASILLIREKD